MVCQADLVPRSNRINLPFYRTNNLERSVSSFSLHHRLRHGIQVFKNKAKEGPFHPSNGKRSGVTVDLRLITLYLTFTMYIEGLDHGFWRVSLAVCEEHPIGLCPVGYS